LKGHAKLHGLRDLKKTLETVSPREAKNILRRTTFGLAVRVRDRMKERVPVDEGNLQRSIKAKRNRGTRTRVEASVIADRSGGRTGTGFHWWWVEQGTVKMPAQPYIVPTVEEIRPQVPDLYRQEFGVQFEREMQKRKTKAK